MAAHRKNCPKKIPSDVFRTKGEGSQFVQTTLPMTSLMCQTSLKSPVNWVALIMMAIKVENMMQDWNKSVQTTAFKPPYKWKINMHYLKGCIQIDVSNKQNLRLKTTYFNDVSFLRKKPWICPWINFNDMGKISINKMLHLFVECLTIFFDCNSGFLMNLYFIKLFFLRTFKAR